MHSRAAVSKLLASTCTPFLYPCLERSCCSEASTVGWITGQSSPRHRSSPPRRCQSTAVARARNEHIPHAVSKTDVNQYDDLDPETPDHSTQLFADACTVTLAAGAGGHGCISFLREKYIANGPANGGDGGTGGSVYIQAVRGETSLHKIARRGTLKAGRGRNGQGSLKGGARGQDVLLTVPVGTVIRERWRHDPLVEEERLGKNVKGYGQDSLQDDVEDGAADQTRRWRRDKWLLYPGILPKSFSSADFPALPRPRRSNLTATEPAAPLHLDLDRPMDHPMLLAAGAMGGLGNPHFVTKSIPRPKYATKGEDGTRIQIHLELKILADVGLVGLPNAGKSTLLRALTRSRTRVGDWAFTTLAPNIGTVVLDTYTARPRLVSSSSGLEPRASFTIADIPGLIEDAHLDRGLGLGFLRHIERAAVLAFVIDLSTGDAVDALKALWREVDEYENLREREVNAETQRHQPAEDGMVKYSPFESSISPGFDPEPIAKDDVAMLDPPVGRKILPLSLPPISSKPWFVVGTKADLEDTRENFLHLREYLQQVQIGLEEHPSGKKNAWKKDLHAVPVSAINKEGVDPIVEIVVKMLDAG